MTGKRTLRLFEFCKLRSAYIRFATAAENSEVTVRPSLQLRAVQNVELEAYLLYVPHASLSSSAGCRWDSQEWYLVESSRDVSITIPDNNVIAHRDLG